MKPRLSCRPARDRALAPLVAAVVAASVLTGCAAGQRAQTAAEVESVDGARIDVGAIALRNIGVAAPATGASYAKDASADLVVDIVNNGTSPDALVSVSTPAAASVVLTPPSASSATSASALPSVPSSPVASGSVPPTSPAGGSGTQIAIAANQLVRIGAGQGSGAASLDQLTSPLVPGQSIQMTFTFRNAGAVTVRIPVKLRPGQTGGATVPVAPTGEG